MPHPLSVRFHNPELLDRLKSEAAVRRLSTSALAEELIEEGLRVRRHPLVTFRDGPAGRRAALVGGPDVWEVVSGVVGGDVPVGDRVARAVVLFGLAAEEVEAALDYYAAFPEEVDGEIAMNRAEAEEAEAHWLRRQRLIAG